MSRRVQVSWNGGRNGCASCIFGFGWIPNKKYRTWSAHLYLGLWLVIFRSKNFV